MKKFFCVILLLFMNGVGIAQFKSGEQVDGSFDSLLTMRISTASKYWETASQAPASVSIITSEDIKALGYRTLDEVLSSIRSFYITYDRNYTYLGVRGFGRPTDFNSRILLLVNGTSLNENFYGSAPVGTDFGINLNSVERIEVVCGPGSSLYGSGAMFAVINVITKKGVGVDGINLSYAYGSNKDSRFGFTFGKEFENGIDVMLSGLWADIKGENIYYNEYDTDSTNFGIAENLDWDRFYSFLSTIKYKNMIFQGLMTRREKGIPTGAYGVNFNDPISSTVDRYLLFELRYEDDETSKLGTMGRIYYGDYYYTGTYPYDILWWDKTNGRWLGGEIRLRYDCDPSNRVIGGIEYISNFRADYKNWNEKEIVFDKNFPHSLISFYFQDQFQFLNTYLLP